MLFQAGSVECFTQPYQLYSFIILLPLLLLLPIAAFLVSKRIFVLPSAQPLLAAPYRERAQHYESIILLRRLLLVLVPAFLALSSPLAAAFGAFAICCLSLMAQMALRPFADPLCNRVETLLLSIQLALAAIALTDAQALQDGAAATDATAVLQATLLAIGVVCAVVAMLHAERNKALSCIFNRDRNVNSDPLSVNDADNGVSMSRSFRRLRDEQHLQRLLDDA